MTARPSEEQEDPKLRTAITRLNSAQRAVAWEEHGEAAELVRAASDACREWLAVMDHEEPRREPARPDLD